MLDEEISSLLEDAGYQFAPESARYRVVSGATENESEHSSEFISDELGIDLEDLQRWEDEQLAAAGLMRADPEAPAPQ